MWLSPLTPATTYCYRIRATDLAGNATVSTSAAYEFSTPPASTVFQAGMLLACYTKYCDPSVTANCDAVSPLTSTAAAMCRYESGVNQPGNSDGDLTGDFGTGTGPDYFRGEWKGYIETPPTQNARTCTRSASSRMMGRRWFWTGACVRGPDRRGYAERCGSVELVPGQHKLYLLWFEQTGNARVSLTWERATPGPGGNPPVLAKSPVPWTSVSVRGDGADTQAPSLTQAGVRWDFNGAQAKLRTKFSEDVSATVQLGPNATAVCCQSTRHGVLCTSVRPPARRLPRCAGSSTRLGCLFDPTRRTWRS